MKLGTALFALGGLAVAVADDFPCDLVRVDTQIKATMEDTEITGMESKESWTCLVDTETTYGYFDVPGAAVRQAKVDNDVSGLAHVQDAKVDHANAMIRWQHNSTLIETFPPSNHRRHLVQTSGEATVLVVRVNYKGKTPTLSRNQLAGRVFGLGTIKPRNDMANQFEACSFGKFTIEPFVGNGVRHGVVDIRISDSVSGSNSVMVLQNKVLDAVKARFPIGQINHIMMVMPDAGLRKGGGSYIAYAFLRSKVSVFHNLWAGRLSALMHEVGHNLNLHHSGKGSVEYGDSSGYMGFGSTEVGGPDKCFNAQKHWTLGWFEDRSLSLDLMDLPWTGTLASFVHYNKTSLSQPVVITVGGRTGQKVYLQYNRAEGINKGTNLYINRVTVTTATLALESLKSKALGGIPSTAGSRFRIANFEGSGKSAFITVCSRQNLPISKVRLSIHLQDGVQQQVCDDNPVEPVRCENAARSVYFYVENKGLKNCQWLKNSSKRPKRPNKWVRVLCVHNHLANHYCRETCDKTCHAL